MLALSVRQRVVRRSLGALEHVLVAPAVSGDAHGAAVIRVSVAVQVDTCCPAPRYSPRSAEPAAARLRRAGKSGGAVKVSGAAGDGALSLAVNAATLLFAGGRWRLAGCRQRPNGVLRTKARRDATR